MQIVNQHVVLSCDGLVSLTFRSCWFFPRPTFSVSTFPCLALGSSLSSFQPVARYVTHDDPALVDPNFDPLQDSHARISRRPDDFYPTRTPYETRVYPGSPAEEKGYKARGHYLMDVVKGSSELTLFEEGTEYHEDEMFAGF